MKIRLFTILLVSTFFLTSCGGVTPIVPTVTSTTVPTKTPSPTSTLLPTITPTEPVSTIVFATTTLTPVGKEETAAILTDSDILREFAGEYGYSDGFWVYSVSISSDKTFHAEILPDIGGHFVTDGKISIQDGQIGLKSNTEESIFFNGVYYAPIRWGQRKYLIETDNIVDFCKSTKSSGFYSEPRDELSVGIYFLKNGDDKIDVTGFPISPAGEKLCQSSLFSDIGFEGQYGRLRYPHQRLGGGDLRTSG